MLSNITSVVTDRSHVHMILPCNCKHANWILLHINRTKQSPFAYLQISCLNLTMGTWGGFRTWTRQDEFTAWTWSEPSWGKGIPVLALEPLSDCHPKLGIYISSVTAKRQCPLCDQAGESIQHLLISCAFARQVWFIILQRLGLRPISPVSTSKFSSWWYRAIKDVPKDMKKGLIHSFPWLPRKFVSTGMSVFNGANPSITILLQTITNECILWCSAGAKGLQELLVGLLVVDWFFLSFCCCSLSLCLY